MSENNTNRLLREYGRFGDLDSPRISVVIPAHNEEAYISRAVESVLRQDYKGHVEVIIVSNGSTDNISEVVKGYAHKGVKLYETEKKGIGLARNHGAQMATGDVIVFLDADTEMGDGFLDRVKEGTRKGYVGGFASIESESKGLGDSLYFGWQNFFNKMLTPVRNISRYLPEPVRKHVPKTGQGAAMYVRKDVFHDMRARGQGFREALKSWEDVDFIGKLHNYGWVDFINDKTVVTSDRRLRKEGLARMWLKRTRGYFFPEDVGREEYRAYRPALEVE